MRRILVYAVIIIQVLIITVFVFQLERIDETGTEIRIETEEKYENDGDDFPLSDDAYLEYKISTVPDDQWSGRKDLNYGEKVYVLLEENEEGIYEASEGSDKKIKHHQERSVLVPASYGYLDETSMTHEVNYKFQHLDQVNRFGTFNYLDDLEITLKVNEWGQYKLLDISLQK